MGEKVSCGSEIARVGQTGNATGPHLHLEIWRNGAALDPADYLTELLHGQSKRARRLLGAARSALVCGRGQSASAVPDGGARA